MHQIKNPTTLSQTAIMEMNCEPTLTFVGNSWKFIVGEKQRHKMYMRKGLTTGKALSLGGKLLHCGRRVEQ